MKTKSIRNFPLRNLLFCIFFQIPFSALLVAQNNTVSIPFKPDQAGLMWVDATINGCPHNFIFDTGSSGVVISSAVYKSLTKNGCFSSSDVTGNTQVILANGSKEDALIINIKSIVLGGCKVKNIEAFVMPDPNAPLLIGQNIFNTFGKITVDNINQKILMEKNAAAVQDSTDKIKELKIIPCSLPKVADGSEIRTTLNDMDIATISEEKNVPPPQKAVNRIKTGLTIRYFDNQDHFIATRIKNKLETNSRFSGISIQIENMLPFFNYKAIPGYIEIWIK